MFKMTCFQAEIDLKNVRSLFTFNLDSQLDNYLVVGFNQNSHLLKINDEELEETQIEGNFLKNLICNVYRATLQIYSPRIFKHLPKS